MDFRFNINNLLPKRINKITHTLIPEGFKGNRREYNDCQRLLTRILDDMGEASAKAQGLNRTITSAVKLRDTDHIIYLMVDNEGNNGLGSVVGLLKTGSKSLFIFDDNGLDYQLKPRCILDFYVHESRQRMGLGFELYQHMLSTENLKPIKMAIDRPSDKFLTFLMKHYGLTSIIPQNNKFVVFKGFFDDEIKDSKSTNKYSCIFSPDKQKTECNNQSNDIMDMHSTKNTSFNGTPVARSAYGRYAASRPPCSMANIIHNTAISEKPMEHARPLIPKINMDLHERPSTLNFYTEEIKQTIDDEVKSDNQYSIPDEQKLEIMKNSLQDFQNKSSSEPANEPDSVTLKDNDTSEILSTANNECLKIDDEVIVENTSNKTSCSQEVVAGNQQTTNERLDLKFYHSPLW